MNYQIFLIFVVFSAMFLSCNIPDSFGHGLGTETMPPVMIDETQATLQVASTTSLDTGIRQITISLFETESVNVINNVCVFNPNTSMNERTPLHASSCRLAALPWYGEGAARPSLTARALATAVTAGRRRPDSLLKSADPRARRTDLADVVLAREALR